MDPTKYEEEQEGVMLDTPSKIAEWMRNADYAFDFRGASQWERSGGITVTTYNPDIYTD